jgi:hypothetical protein
MPSYCSQLSCWQRGCRFHVQEAHFGKYSAKWCYEPEVVPEAYREYEIITSEGTSIERIPVKAVVVVFFINNVESFKLMKNTYRTLEDEFMLLEWFQVSDKTLLLFNDEHGCISVFDADTGIKLHSSYNDDVFISDYRLYDDRTYLYVSGWIWAPFAVRSVFHIPSLLIQPEYEATNITTSDTEDRINPGCTLLGCQSCEELLMKKDEIETTIMHRNMCNTFNENRLKSNMLLKKITPYANEECQALIRKITETDRTTFYVDTLGLTTGGELFYGYVWNQPISNEYAPFMMQFAQRCWQFTEKLPFPEINLLFKIYTDIGNLQIIIKHKLKEIENYKPYYEGDVQRYDIIPHGEFLVHLSIF